MQTIWTRVIQARSTCHCPSCLSGPAAVSRRPTSAITRQNIRYGDAVTFVYSAILATAAVADARRKDAKRKILDDSITQATDALKTVEAEQQRRLQALRITRDEPRFIGAQQQQRVEVFRNATPRHFEAEENCGAQGTDTHSRGAVLQVAERNRRLTEPGGNRYDTPTVSDIDEAKVEESVGPGVHQEMSSAAALPKHGMTSHAEAEKNPLGHHAVQSRWRIFRETSAEKALLQDSNTIEANHMSDKIKRHLASLTALLPEGTLFKDPFPDYTKGQYSSKVWKAPVDRSGGSMHRIVQANTSIAKLIYRLLVISLDVAEDGECILFFGNGAPWKLTSQHRQELYVRITDMTERLTKLRSKTKDIDFDKIPRLSFPSYSFETDNGLSEDSLHKALRNSLAQECALKALLPKLCYILLVSCTPPSVHTYNMLIIRLCQLQYYQVASAVVDSMLECRVRPNEITAAAILRFYSCTKDLRAFKGYISCMNVERGHGLSTAPLGTKITPENRNHFFAVRCKVRRINHRNTEHTLRYIEKTPRNVDTYLALINGWLGFSKLPAALREYIAMLRSGWTPSMTLLCPLLQHCTLTRNWRWGQAIWNEIVEISEVPSRNAYRWMLQLCAIQNKNQEFSVIVQHGTSRGRINVGTSMEDFALSDEDFRDLIRRSRLWYLLATNLEVPNIPPLSSKYPSPIELRFDAQYPSLERAVSDRIDRASIHLSQIELGAFQQSRVDAEPIPPIIKPYRYLAPRRALSRHISRIAKRAVTLRLKYSLRRPAQLASADLLRMRTNRNKREASQTRTAHAIASELALQGRITQPPPKPRRSLTAEWASAAGTLSLLHSPAQPISANSAPTETTTDSKEASPAETPHAMVFSPVLQSPSPQSPPKARNSLDIEEPSAARSKSSLHSSAQSEGRKDSQTKTPQGPTQGAAQWETKGVVRKIFIGFRKVTTNSPANDSSIAMEA